MENENSSDQEPQGDDVPPPPIENSLGQEPTQQPSKKSFGSSETDWALLTHLSGLACFIGIPSFVGPLVLWLIKKDEMPLVDRAGKEALNFHLTMLIVMFLSGLLTFFFIGIIPLMGALLLTIIFPIIACVEANKGNDYYYPLTYRFIN